MVRKYRQQRIHSKIFCAAVALPDLTHERKSHLIPWDFRVQISLSLELQGAAMRVQPVWLRKCLRTSDLS